MRRPRLRPYFSSTNAPCVLAWLAFRVPEHSLRPPDGTLMCGIAGIVSKDRRAEVDPRVLGRMTDVLTHRGPDDRGTEILGNIGLGNRRLSIIDIEGGHQPLSTPDGELWITYNGELYNYVELRAELIERGYPLRTHSDTEVLLALYAEHGIGMF